MVGRSPGPPEAARVVPYQPSSLADVLDRVLDKGLVVAGDIRVSLGNVEILTLRIRLLLCSIDKAEQVGINWWRHDRFLKESLEQLSDTAPTITRLEARIAELERQLEGRRADAPARPAE